MTKSTISVATLALHPDHLPGLRTALGEVQRLEAGVASTRWRHGVVCDRLTDLAAEHEKVQSEKVPLYDAPEPDHVDRLIKGEPAPMPAAQEIAVRHTHNVAVRARAERAEVDINLLTAERDQCAAELAQRNEELTEAREAFAKAASKAIQAQWPTEVHRLIEDVLLPMRACIRNSGRAAIAGGYISALTLHHRSDDGHAVQLWPRTDTTHEDLDRAFERIIAAVRGKPASAGK